MSVLRSFTCGKTPNREHTSPLVAGFLTREKERNTSRRYQKVFNEDFETLSSLFCVPGNLLWAFMWGHKALNLLYLRRVITSTVNTYLRSCCPPPPRPLTSAVHYLESSVLQNLRLVLSLFLWKIQISTFLLIYYYIYMMWNLSCQNNLGLYDGSPISRKSEVSKSFLLWFEGVF